MSGIDAITLRELKKRIGETVGPTFPVSVSSGTLELLIDAYMDRAALIVVNEAAKRKIHRVAQHLDKYQEAATKSAACSAIDEAIREINL